MQKEQSTGIPVLPRTLSACAFHWKLLWDLLYDVHLLQNGGCFTRRLVHFCIHLLSLSVYDLLVWRQCGGTAFDLVQILRSLFKMDTFSLGLPSLTRWLQKQCTGRFHLFQCAHYNFCWGDGVGVDDLISLHQTVFEAIVMHRILYTPQHCSHESLIVFRSAVAMVCCCSGSVLVCYTSNLPK